jgi:hypothetical protein
MQSPFCIAPQGTKATKHLTRSSCEAQSYESFLTIPFQTYRPSNEAEHGIAIRSPFRLLFWNFDHIDAAAKGPDEKLRKVTTLLQRVLKDEFRELLAKRREMVATQEMNFKTLWTLFKPEITCSDPSR